MRQNNNQAPSEDVSALVEGIMRSSDEETRVLMSETSDYAAAKAKFADAKAQAIMDEAEANAREQIAAIRKNADSRLALERRKADLGAREKLVRDIESRARMLLEEGVSEAEYRDFLLEWTVEAAVGLGSDSAAVHTCKAERALMDDGILPRAEAMVLKLCGRKVTLSLAEGGYLGDRGIELVAEGGRLSYDNRIATRFDRAAAKIRAIVYKVAYGDDLEQ